MKIDIPRHAKNKKNHIKIHEWDCWDIDYTLALIIAPLIKRVRASSLIPHCVFDQDGMETEEDMGIARERWNQILDKIIWSMEQISSREKDETKMPRDVSKTLHDLILKSGDDSARDKILEEYRQKRKIYTDRIQEGCELFGKYFRSFWT